MSDEIDLGKTPEFAIEEARRLAAALTPQRDSHPHHETPMNIEDLQAAVEWYDAHGANLGTHVDSMAEAVRLIANPNIEAAARAVSIYVHGYELPPNRMRLLEKQLAVGVAAALTPQGDTHKHKWTKITNEGVARGHVCAECFAMTATSPGDTDE